MQYTRFLLVALLANVAGCINDPGGGTYHQPPATIQIGQPYTVVLECTAISGGSDRRYKKVKCLYTFNDEKTEHAVPMTFDHKDAQNGHAFFKCELPLFQTEGILKYRMEFEFDRQRSSRSSPLIKVVPATRN